MKWNGIFVAGALVLLVAIGSVSAFMGRGIGNNEDVKQALEDEDYDAFIAAANQDFAEKMTEDRFDEMIEMHAHRETIRDAIEAEDYDAWLDAVTNDPNRIDNIISEDNFDTFVDMHEARQSGDHDTADELAQELGIERGHGKMNSFKHGFKQGFRHGRMG